VISGVSPDLPPWDLNSFERVKTRRRTLRAPERL